MQSKLKFRIRCSAISKIMAGDIGLTSIQEETLKDLELRRDGKHPKGLKLTDKMMEQLAELNHKKNNPELPQGAKTYCKQWLKEQLYKRRKNVSSWQIEKGHATEQDGFTRMTLNLGLGMVYSNTEFRENDFLMGTCDLDHAPNDTVYDNKSSSDYDTFPLFEEVIPNKDYEDQIQGYCELWDRSNGSVVYTLNDMPIEMIRKMFNKPWLSDNEKQEQVIQHVYTLDYWNEVKEEFFPNADEVDFVEIPESQRVKEFKFKRDRPFIEKVRQRVELCQKYIDHLQTKL